MTIRARHLAVIPIFMVARVVGERFGLFAGQGHGRPPLLVAVGFLALVWALRAAWLSRATRQAVAALPRAAVPPALAEAAARAGVAPRVVAVRGATPTAFCAGLLRPRVFATLGLVRGLEPSELEAVLVHEAAHARRLDPLRRLLGRAAADVLLLVPIAGWLADRQASRAELAADRHAIDHAGRAAVAGALQALAAPPRPVALGTPFDGAVAARVAQVTGDPPPRTRPPIGLLLASLCPLAATLTLSTVAGLLLLTLFPG